MYFTPGLPTFREQERFEAAWKATKVGDGHLSEDYPHKNSHKKQEAKYQQHVGFVVLVEEAHCSPPLYVFGLSAYPHAYMILKEGL